LDPGGMRGGLCAAQVQDADAERSAAGTGREKGEGCKCDTCRRADRRYQHREPIHPELSLPIEAMVLQRPRGRYTVVLTALSQHHAA
jgi:hypothetical protein